MKIDSFNRTWARDKTPQGSNLIYIVKMFVIIVQFTSKQGGHYHKVTKCKISKLCEDKLISSTRIA